MNFIVNQLLFRKRKVVHERQSFDNHRKNRRLLRLSPGQQWM